MERITNRKREGSRATKEKTKTRESETEEERDEGKNYPKETHRDMASPARERDKVRKDLRREKGVGGWRKKKTEKDCKKRKRKE